MEELVKDLFPGWFIALWIFSALVGLGLLGVGVWAVIALVAHVTG
jgi:hypothetical protein